MAGNDRDRPLDATVQALIDRKKTGRKRPRYPSEEERVKATWDLAPETLARVRAAAAELRVSQYRLVEKLINEGLDRWEEGELDLKPVPVVTTWGLE